MNQHDIYLIEEVGLKRAPNVLLTTPDKIKRDSYIDTNVDDNTLRIAIRAVQDMVVEDVLGTCMFEKIKSLICEGLINDPLQSHYKLLLDEYISQIFCYGVPAEINIPISYKMRNSGTVRVETDTTNNPAITELQYTHNWYKKKRDFYISRAVDYIRCNAECYGIKCTCGKCHCVKAPLGKKYSIGLPLSNSNSNRRK